MLGEVQSQAHPHLFSERPGLAGAVPRALLLGTEDKSEVFGANRRWPGQPVDGLAKGHILDSIKFYPHFSLQLSN